MGITSFSEDAAQQFRLPVTDREKISYREDTGKLLFLSGANELCMEITRTMGSI